MYRVLLGVTGGGGGGSRSRRVFVIRRAERLLNRGGAQSRVQRGPGTAGKGMDVFSIIDSGGDYLFWTSTRDGPLRMGQPSGVD